MFFKNISFSLIVEALRGLEIGTLIISHDDSQKIKNPGKEWIALGTKFPKNYSTKKNVATTAVPFLFPKFKVMR